MAKIPFDKIFLMFVNKDNEQDRFSRPSDVFKAIERIKNPNLKFLKKTRDRCYWNKRDNTSYRLGLLSPEQISQKNQKIISQERLINSPSEFRRFLLTHPIKIFFSLEKEVPLSSHDLFLDCYSFEEVLRSEFYSCEGKPIYADEDEFQTILDQSFSFLKQHDLEELSDLKKIQTLIVWAVSSAISNIKRFLGLFPMQNPILTTEKFPATYKKNMVFRHPLLSDLSCPA